jgi:uncharacterized protein
MSEQTSQEPTMEEILASIRRIISEDESPAEAAPAANEAAPAPAAVAPAPAPEPIPAPEPVVAHAPEPTPVHAPEPMHAFEDEEVLELTDRYDPAPQPAPAQSIGDIDAFEAPRAPEPAPAPAPQPAPVYAAAPQPAPAASILSPQVAQAASASFDNFARSFQVSGSGRSLEDLVTELLKPMLREWLQQNLNKEEVVRSLLTPMLQAWINQNAHPILDANLAKVAEEMHALLPVKGPQQ